MSRGIRALDVARSSKKDFDFALFIANSRAELLISAGYMKEVVLNKVIV